MFLIVSLARLSVGLVTLKDYILSSLIAIIVGNVDLKCFAINYMTDMNHCYLLTNRVGRQKY